MFFPRSRCIPLVWAVPLVSALSCGAPRLIGGSGAGAESGATGNEGEDDTFGSDTEGDNVDENACLPGIGDCPDDQKCSPYVTEPGSCCVDAAQCVPLQGDQKPGEDCRRDQYGDTCEREAFCWYSGYTFPPGECLQMCDGSDPGSCAGFGMPDATCVSYNDGILPICHAMCNPLAPDCGFYDACIYSGSEVHAYFCRRFYGDPESDHGKDGAECEDVCNIGFQCWPGDTLAGCKGERCCTSDCDLRGDGHECTDPAETCVPAFDPDDLPHPMFQNVGVCGLRRSP